MKEHTVQAGEVALRVSRTPCIKTNMNIADYLTGRNTHLAVEKAGADKFTVQLWVDGPVFTDHTETTLTLGESSIIYRAPRHDYKQFFLEARAEEMPEGELLLTLTSNFRILN